MFLVKSQPYSFLENLHSLSLISNKKEVSDKNIGYLFFNFSLIFFAINSLFRCVLMNFVNPSINV